MPKYSDNTLIIHCSNDKTMKKIGDLIFKDKDNGTKEFTMTKLLPMPEGHDVQPGSASTCACC